MTCRECVCAMAENCTLSKNVESVFVLWQHQELPKLGRQRKGSVIVIMRYYIILF